MSGTLKKPGTKKSRGSRSRHVKYALLGMQESLRDQLGKTHSVICNDESDIRDAINKATKDTLWISSEAGKTDLLLRVMHAVSARRMGNLFMFEKPRPNTIPFLHAAFQTVVGESPSFVTLPIDQLAEVISLPDDASQDLFIGGTVDQRNGLLSLVRGNFGRVTVPLDVFRPSGKWRPDFRHFSIGEYGHGVVFGEYEASAAFVLYAIDPDYRKRRNAKRRAEDKGFGPSLRRLRTQKGLKRKDFANVTAKTIARLERGEARKARGTTLRTICETLGVAADEIETY